MNSEGLDLIHEGKNLIFTFKSEAKEFLIRNQLTAEYNDGEMIDDEHFQIVGYKSKIYWIAE